MRAVYEFLYCDKPSLQEEWEDEGNEDKEGSLAALRIMTITDD
jgi:hypothetical protein